ncbi:formate dehydrogenase accessory sulfurtransferase FdhD [Pseudalkalibacillus caeni]|uniref:Sulfur carrier protein FdhD n=1 Tax=Exobacillus caeni TaxID=2574798 RepID=A0A5R9EXH1_9BACL|nr:formate dehydrogenase accessory sulfurtransferase FdhD [Pseudalkalibacillus caeni]TLS35972.1 formate dehydrogenase accessory sulfurtransferase FdhD [Pseudalkalibacillus caeni]
MNDNVMKNHRILKYEGGELIETEDQVADEFPLTIFVNGEEFATMVCTPSYLEELIVGFLASEGIIRFKDEILALNINEDRGFAYVDVKNKQAVNSRSHSKRFIGSCCGKSRQFYLQSDVKTAKTIMRRSTISVDQCINLMKEMQDSSSDFHMTGGLHNAALCNTEEAIVSRSDIGRHNALDKIYGYCMQNKISLADKVIAFSGRISSEVLLKVSKIGVGIILSKSAPTTLALELADDLGITAVGFIRGNRLNVYTHPERITISK